MPGGLHLQLERRFESWGHFVATYPRSLVVASLSLAAVCSTGLAWLRVDVTFESFLNPDDPVLIAYESFRERFGRDERIIISAEPGPGASARGVFESGFLERLREFHQAIEERVPYLDDVTSLVNARDTRADGDTLLVDDFLEPWPEGEAELALARERALANPLFRNSVISPDGSITTLVLELQLYSSIGVEEDTLGGFDSPTLLEAPSRDPPPEILTGAETAELVFAVHDLVEEFRSPDFVLHVAGSPLILQDVAAAMARDMPRFIMLAILTIAGFLMVLFRRLTAVVIPLLVVCLTVLSTFGLMGWLGQTIHVPTQILPSLLLAVGIGDSVHLLSIFFGRLRAGDDSETALVHALAHSGLALLLTSVTTAAGLASFSTSALAPIGNLGVFAPFGVMMAFVLSITLLPAVLCLVPFERERTVDTRETPDQEVGGFDRLLGGLGRFATRHPVVVCVSIAIVIASAAGASRLTLSHDPLRWLQDDVEVARSTRYIDEKLGGSVSFEILLETDRDNGIRDPATLERMAELGRRLETEPRDGLVSGQTVSLADVVKEIHRALNEDRPEAYTIPQDSRLLAQELLLFENSGSDDLEDLVDSQYRVARIGVRMPWRDAVHYTAFFDEADADVQAVLASDGAPSTTGVLALLVRAISAVVESIALSYLLAFGVITPLMVLLLGNLRTGLLAMVPNTLPILMTLGVMGFCGFPLDAFSLLTGGIAIGLAVDDTIHFMHNYRRYRAQGLDLESAVGQTLQTTGRALLITTIVLSIGFLGFVLSSMGNLTNFGLLVSFAITMAFFADVLLAPALLALFDRREATR